MNITFRQLRLFLALAETGSVSAAARCMHVTQPTASMQLREVSQAIGLPLYEVISRRVHLTEAGHALAHDGVVGEKTWHALEHPGHHGSHQAASWCCDSANVHPLAWPVVAAALAEIGAHEEPDGSGYPFHLTADAMPLEARILRVADIFQAMVQQRPYRKGLGDDEVTAFMRQLADEGRIDRSVASALLADLPAARAAACPPGADLPEVGLAA